MAVQFLSPGQTHHDVTRMKRRLVTRLLKLGFDPIATKIAIRSTTYGPNAEQGVRKFQKAKNLDVDGLVGEDTWAALGVKERVVGKPKTFQGESHHKGLVVVAAGANQPGKPLQRPILDFVAKMADRINKPITVTTGTNHSKFTVSGNVSLHFTGQAVDIGMFANGGTDDSPVGDRIMAAACFLAGDSKQGAKSKARTGGLFNFTHGGKSIQCIWKTNVGGNHHNHVHVSVRPA
jgi:hypothetical protein